MAFTVKDIADALGARVEGDPNIKIDRPAEPSSSGPADLALAMDKAYAGALGSSEAVAAILWEGADWRALGLKAAIFIDRPRYAMAAVTGTFERPRLREPGVHETAIISPSASLGKDVSIGPFCVIGAGAVIGERSVLMSHVSVAEGVQLGADALLHEGVRLGARVQIGDGFIAHMNAVVGSDGFSFVTPDPGAIDEVKGAGRVSKSYDPQEFARINSIGSVGIGDNVELGANSAIDRGTIADTVIGSGTKIDNLVQIGHNVRVGKTCLLCGQVGIGGSAVISDRVVLGGQVGVADHVRVGENVIAAGKAGISSNVPPNRAIMGNPAIKMDANYASYKQYRRLPRLAKKLEDLEDRIRKLED